MVKMHRILDLYDHPPEHGWVICVDEFGPLNLQSRKGKACGRSGRRSDYAPPATATTA